MNNSFRLRSESCSAWLGGRNGWELADTKTCERACLPDERFFGSKSFFPVFSCLLRSSGSTPEVNFMKLKSFKKLKIQALINFSVLHFCLSRNTHALHRSRQNYEWWHDRRNRKSSNCCVSKMTRVICRNVNNFNLAGSRKIPAQRLSNLFITSGSSLSACFSSPDSAIWSSRYSKRFQSSEKDLKLDRKGFHVSIKSTNYPPISFCPPFVPLNFITIIENCWKELHRNLPKTSCSEQVLAKRYAEKKKDRSSRILRYDRSTNSTAKNANHKDAESQSSLKQYLTHFFIIQKKSY